MVVEVGGLGRPVPSVNVPFRAFATHTLTFFGEKSI